ncbi:hypothetical protein TRVL_07999 [Trypanosoma vivax]|nr:hypothetical protein TRVL_07999 [Trypanosoma vivax]
MMLTNAEVCEVSRLVVIKVRTGACTPVSFKPSTLLVFETLYCPNKGWCVRACVFANDRLCKRTCEKEAERYLVEYCSAFEIFQSRCVVVLLLFDKQVLFLF